MSKDKKIVEQSKTPVPANEAQPVELERNLDAETIHVCCGACGSEYDQTRVDHVAVWPPAICGVCGESLVEPTPLPVPANEAQPVEQPAPANEATMAIIDHLAVTDRNLDAAALAEQHFNAGRHCAHAEALDAYEAACNARMDYTGDDEATMVRLIRAKKVARVVLDAASQAIRFAKILEIIRPYADYIPAEGIAIRLVDGNIQIVNAPFLVSEKIGNMESRIMTDHNSRRVPSPPASSSGSNPSPNPNGLKYIVQWPEIGENWVNSGEVVTYKSLTAAARDIQGMWKVESQVSGNAFWSVPTNYKGSPGESYRKNYKGWNFTLTIQ